MQTIQILEQLITSRSYPQKRKHRSTLERSRETCWASVESILQEEFSGFTDPNTGEGDMLSVNSCMHAGPPRRVEFALRQYRRTSPGYWS